jgi:predicted MPP superfamily phosphohydrolase
VKWLGGKPLYFLLLLTEKPVTWAPWQVALVPLALAASAGVMWASVTADFRWGWVVGLGLAVMAAADWVLLAALPRCGLSFGPVQPALLGLAGLRWLVVAGGALAATRWPIAALIVAAWLEVFIFALTVYGTVIEPFGVKVTCTGIGSPKLSNPGTLVRVVQLSDLHVERLTRRERALPALVAKLNPDIIVLTGDFLSTSYKSDPRALDDLGTLLAQLDAPAGIYAVWGTVEVDLPDLLRPVLEEHGVVVLEDRAVQVNVGGHATWLIGVSCSRDLSSDGARLRRLWAQVPRQAFSLLLYHTPDLMSEAASLGVDLYLAGHTHGGQWRLPWFGAIVTSSRFWKRYEAGHYREGSTHLYVSRGLGMEGFGAPRARFFCPPEVPLFALAAAVPSEGCASDHGEREP